jgi:hypothetical protein
MRRIAASINATVNSAVDALAPFVPVTRMPRSVAAARLRDHLQPRQAVEERRTEGDALAVRDGDRRVRHPPHPFIERAWHRRVDRDIRPLAQARDRGRGRIDIVVIIRYHNTHPRLRIHYAPLSKR